MTETLVLPPQTLDQMFERRCVRSIPGAGKSGATAVVERRMRRWKITWTDQPKSYLVELRRMIAATFGPVLPFNWTPPGGSSLRVRVAGPETVYVRPGAASFTVELVLEEER